MELISLLISYWYLIVAVIAGVIAIIYFLNKVEIADGWGDYTQFDYKKLRELDSREKRKERAKSFTGKCYLCDKDISSVDGWYCKYCKKWHCGKHRLPENHKCENPKLPEGMGSHREVHKRGGVVVYGK